MQRKSRAKAVCAALVLGLSCWSSAGVAEGGSSIGYPSVAAALAALRADPSATESTQQGWTLFERAGGLELWSFAPRDHPAYPSAAKRTAYQDANGGWRVETRLLCQSTKAACDALMEKYNQLDAQMREDIRRQHGATGS